MNIASDNFWNFKSKIDYVDKWLLMDSPIPVLLIWLSYMIFILKLGPDYMKEKAAFKLKGLLIVYNISQVVSSAYMLYLGMQILKPDNYLFISCTHNEESMQMITGAMHFFLLGKLSEFLETIFFVLRKKQHQVSFLHVYHHTVMFLSTWFTLKFEPTQITIFSGWINAAVHIIMYAYYGLSAFPSLSKYLWWKKYITRLQLIQFAMINLHALGNFMFSECEIPKSTLSLIMFSSLSFAWLFSNFYIKSYRKDNKNIEVRNVNAKPIQKLQ